MILLIDNYDSFTYNLVHYLSELGADVEVIRNDAKSASEIVSMPNLDAIVISPGPCTPNEAGVCLDLIKEVIRAKIPLFGVCLGHEVIGQAFGGDIVKVKPMHGKTSNITHNDSVIFKDVKNPFSATRYHSLVISEEGFPKELEVTARSEDGLIMAVSHKKEKIYGVQFHPESIASECGHTILKNFLKMVY